MDLRFSTLVLVTFSGLVSAAMAGILLTMLVMGAAAGPIGILLGLFFGFLGVWPAVKIAGVPAILLGGSLWTVGGGHRWARNRGLWAGVGAATGLACYAVAVSYGIEGLPDLNEISRLSPAGLASMFAIAGAGAALVFRATMRLLLLFAPEGTAA